MVSNVLHIFFFSKITDLIRLNFKLKVIKWLLAISEKSLNKLQFLVFDFQLQVYKKLSPN